MCLQYSRKTLSIIFSQGINFLSGTDKNIKQRWYMASLGKLISLLLLLFCRWFKTFLPVIITFLLLSVRVELNWIWQLWATKYQSNNWNWIGWLYLVLSHGNVKVMEIGEGKAQHYNKQMDMGRMLLKRELGISSPGWWQDTASVTENRILCSVKC